MYTTEIQNLLKHLTCLQSLNETKLNASQHYYEDVLECAHLPDAYYQLIITWQMNWTRRQASSCQKLKRGFYSTFDFCVFYICDNYTHCLSNSQMIKIPFRCLANDEILLLSHNSLIPWEI